MPPGTSFECVSLLKFLYTRHLEVLIVWLRPIADYAIPAPYNVSNEGHAYTTHST